MHVYYNENDPKAVRWLSELMTAGQIPQGVIDNRSIVDVKPGELKGFTQAHFFAGIGGWAYALKLAGWPADRPVWTGSCPCQPFSVANSRRKAVDNRDLFGTWADLIRELEPPVIFGEQVASPLGLAWFDTVRTDLENAGYAVGGADLCAASVGAPHIRQRLYWVALASSIGSSEGAASSARVGTTGYGSADDSGLGNASSAGGGRDAGAVPRPQESAVGQVWDLANESIAASVDRSIMAHSDDARSQGRSVGRVSPDQRSPWAHSLVGCRDGKWRPVEPGTFPLAHGVPGRVGLLRGYGNAIVPQVAAAFIEATGVI